MAVNVSLDGQIVAKGRAQTQVQAKRKAALRLLLELGCPLEATEDRAGKFLLPWRQLCCSNIAASLTCRCQPKYFMRLCSLVDSRGPNSKPVSEADKSSNGCWKRSCVRAGFSLVRYCLPAGVMACTSVELQVPGAGKPTGGRAFKYPAQTP